MRKTTSTAALLVALLVFAGAVTASATRLEFIPASEEITQIGLQTFACLYRAEAEALIRTEPGGIAYLAEAGARLVMTLTGSVLCPPIMRLGGTYPWTTGSGLTIRLV